MQVTDISSGLSFSYPGDWMSQLVGDTLYFSSGDTSTGAELWAHDTSNHSTWQVADINSGTGAVDLDLTLRFSSVTLCISQQGNPILLLITNCGLTTHQMDPLGGSKTSTPVQTVVILDNTCISSSAIRCISQQMMEARS